MRGRWNSSFSEKKKPVPRSRSEEDWWGLGINLGLVLRGSSLIGQGVYKRKKENLEMAWGEGLKETTEGKGGDDWEAGVLRGF